MKLYLYSDKMFGLSIVFLCFLTHYGMALECYECASETNSGCLTPVDKTNIPIANCDTSEPQSNHTKFFCVSYVKTLIVDNTTYTFRQCTAKENFCAQLKQEENSKGNYKVEPCKLCAGDKCNASDNLTICMMTMLSALILHLSLSPVT